MNPPRFFSPFPLAAGRTLLSESAARHAAVLRLKPGDALTLFDGRGGEYVGRIHSQERDRVWVDLSAWQDIERESPIDLTLTQALQSGEKMALTVQKAVELGASRIVPVTTQRSLTRLFGSRAQKKVARLRAIAVSACEQCGRNRVPEVAPLSDLSDWLRQPSPGANRLMLDPGASITLDSLSPVKSVELLIGAEGGLHPLEAALAREAGFIAVKLGPRVLRTETAGLAALSALQCLWGDFCGKSSVRA